MRGVTTLVVCGLIGLLIGCSVFIPKETRYLRSAQDRATQEEVRRELGEPRATKVLAGGGAVWLYEVRDIEPMSQSSWSTLGSWCDEYRLTFDAGGVLREWTHKSYVHGGELMPVSCNSTVGVEKPAL
jgi:hypothetical protein